MLESLDLSSLRSAGYCFQIELKYRAWKNGHRHVEVPILFPDRRVGASKMTRKIVLEAVWNVWKLRAGDGSGLVRQLVQFGLVGAMGTLTNLLIFFCSSTWPVWAPYAGAMRLRRGGDAELLLQPGLDVLGRGRVLPDRQEPEYRLKALLPEYARFVAVSLGGLAVNLAVLNLVLAVFVLPLKTIANMIGVAAGMIVNFLGYRLLGIPDRYAQATGLAPEKKPAAAARAKKWRRVSRSASRSQGLSG